MSEEAQSERMLVIRAQARDGSAFSQLVARYERRLVYYIRRMLSDEDAAFDVLQEVWLRVFRRLATLDSPEAFRTWPYRIAHDLTIDHLRGRNRLSVTQAEEPEAALDTDAWNELEALENAELVHRTLMQLSAPHQEVLTLRFLEDMNLAEIASVIGCGLGTVKSRLHYAKRALREQIEGVVHER